MSTVSVLLHGNDRLAGAIKERLTKAGCRVVKLDLAGVDSIEISPDLLRSAAVLVLAADEDAGNVDLALTARRLRPDLPLVVRVFEEPLAVYLTDTLERVKTMSMSALAAPAFASATTRAIAERRAANGATVGPELPKVSHPAARIRPDRVLFTAAISFLAAVVVFTLFFASALGLSYLDAMYFVWTTVTTVGYGDIALREASSAAKVVGMVMMFAGAAFLAVLFGLFTDWVVGRRLEILRGRRSVRGSGHIVVAGGGNIGFRVAGRLRDSGHRVVIIEREADNKNVEALRSLGHHVIVADAARDDTLALARVEHSAAVLCVTDVDAVNFQIALLAHARRRDLPVVLRVVSPELSAHVSERGGAVAISPTAIAGEEFSAATLRLANSR
jgi:voltage-gated potassium channel Kch